MASLRELDGVASRELSATPISVEQIKVCTLQHFKRRIVGKLHPSYYHAYNPSAEKPPAHPYFESINQSRIDELLCSLQTMVSGHFNQVKEPDCELEALQNMTGRLSAIKYTNSVKALFIGPQGSGRSSLINSLLDSRERICDAGSGSEAVTTCPMSYELGGRLNTNGGQMHTAIGHMLTWDHFKSIASLYGNYIDLYHWAMETGLRPNTAGVVGKSRMDGDVDDMYAEAKAFATQLESISTFELQESMDQMISRGSEDYIESCQAWVQAAIAKLAEMSASTSGSTDTKRSIVCDSVGTLKKTMRQHTSGPLSVITKSIDVGTEATVLRSGTKIIDISGLDYHDRSWNIIEQDVIDSGSVRLICAEPGIVQWDPRVISAIWESINAVGRENTCVVVTKIDASVEDTEIEEWLETCRQDPLKSISELFMANKCRRKELNEEIMADPNVQIIDDIDNIAPEDIWPATSLEKEDYMRFNYGKHLCNLAKPAMISYNCGRIRASLTEYYHSESDSSDIKVFFTSARDYNSSVGRWMCLERPRPSGTVSGIPELRSHLIGLTGQGRLESLQRHAAQDVATWFKTLQQTCMHPMDQTLSPGAKAVQEQLRAQLGKIRLMVNEIGRSVLLEEPLVSEDFSA